MIAYHDAEWGVPLHDDQKLFEFMVLDAFQAGLSWKTILHRREGFRAAFDNFDAVKIAGYGEDKIRELMLDTRIIRNQLKIRSTVTSAQAFLSVQKEFGTFGIKMLLWQAGRQDFSYKRFHPAKHKSFCFGRRGKVV